MISVIIPLYNKEPIIKRTIQSILSQDYNDYEIIIVNDGSTDKSVDIVKTFTDSRIKLIEQENGGPSKARNTGLLHSKGEWIYYIDADDTISNGLLKSITHIIKTTEADVIMGGIDFKKESGETISIRHEEGYCSNVHKEIFINRLKPCTGSIFYKRQVCLDNMYDETLRRYEDFERFFRVIRHTKVYVCNEPFLAVNEEYSAASNKRTDINEDFVGHLDLKGKSFWEKMCLYQLFLGERPHYPEQCKKLYPSLYRRWDLYMIYQLLKRTQRLWI